MARFYARPTPPTLLRRLLLSAAVLCCALVLFQKSAASLSRTAAQSQADSLQQAILRSAVHCYAVEGAYPESLDYLKEHYGIDWDPEKYVVDYEIIGANLMPSVMVIPLNK